MAQAALPFVLKLCGNPEVDGDNFKLDKTLEVIRQIEIQVADASESWKKGIATVDSVAANLVALHQQLDELKCRADKLDDRLGELRHAIAAEVNRLVGEYLNRLAIQAGRVDQLVQTVDELGTKANIQETAAIAFDARLKRIESRLRHIWSYIELMAIKMPDWPETHWTPALRGCGLGDIDKLAKHSLPDLDLVKKLNAKIKEATSNAISPDPDLDELDADVLAVLMHRAKELQSGTSTSGPKKSA